MDEQKKGLEDKTEQRKKGMSISFFLNILGCFTWRCICVFWCEVGGAELEKGDVT